MFVQVLQGPVSDAAEVRRVLGRWHDELSPGADGWLGSTAGVTDDGAFLAVVRFDSEQAARRNSDRPKQRQSWDEASKAFAGPVEFHDCTEVHLGRGGGSDSPGFAQVIQGRMRDLERARALVRDWDQITAGRRPDLLGTLIAVHDRTSAFTQVAYFTSEAEAREGERTQPPPDPRMQELGSLREDLRYYDLRDPWLLSPR